MSPTLQFLFYLAAFICFLVAAFGHGRWAELTGRVNFVALGLALWVFVPLVAALEAAF